MVHFTFSRYLKGCRYSDSVHRRLFSRHHHGEGTTSRVTSRLRWMNTPFFPPRATQQRSVSQSYEHLILQPHLPFSANLYFWYPSTACTITYKAGYSFAKCFVFCWGLLSKRGLQSLWPEFFGTIERFDFELEVNERWTKDLLNSLCNTNIKGDELCTKDQAAFNDGHDIVDNV